MGNVSSSDHDKVSEQLARRAKKRLGSSSSRKKKKQQEEEEDQGQLQQQQLQKQLPQLEEYPLPQQHLPHLEECPPPQQPPQPLQLLHSKPIYSEEAIGPASPVHNSTGGIEGKDVNRQGSFHVHRQTSNSGSTSKTPRPLTCDGFTPRASLTSQAEFYSRSKAEYSPLTPSSPAPSFSVTSSTTATSASSQIYDPYAATNPTSIQEPTSLYHSAPIVMIPQQPLNQGLNQQEERKYEGTNVLDIDLNGPSISPKRHDIDHQAHYRQQQRLLPADLRLIGTSPEAKEWLKQKPTRSTSHMIHQYNFHGHQYYQTPGAAKPVNSVTRSISACVHSSTSPPVNSNPSSVNEPIVPNNTSLPTSTSKPRPNSITAAAAAIALGDDSALLVDGQETHENASSGDEIPSILPAAPTSLLQTHFDGHFYGHGHGISPLPPLQNSPPLPRRKEPLKGRLVMSRSHLYSPSIASASSVASTGSINSSVAEEIGRDT
ncbi:hypothetical protein EDD21DRAFT_360823 [Dissophora ornata]|nr:hypothetical protein BGZ58_009590 [Dissophora ornata]KAI8606482.1 hypothetical protein EDD21DRAFT_360823 [Dissophora ornata]